jgi:hypothetical protein
MTTAMTTTSPAVTAVLGHPTSVRASRRDLRTVPAAFRSEWIKLTTLRTNKVLLGLSVGVGVAISAALAATSTDPALKASELFIYPLPLVATLALVTGILMFTAEVQHGTLPVALAARPAHWVIVVAKTAMASVVGLSLGATAMVGGYVGAVVGGADPGSASAVTSRALWALLYIALAAVMGLGVGMVVRHGAGAISGLLMWSFVIENLFAPALPDGVKHFLPFSAGYRLLDAGPSFKPPVAIAHELGRPMYALIFGGYAVVSLAVGSFLLARRDAS